MSALEILSEEIIRMEVTKIVLKQRLKINTMTFIDFSGDQILQRRATL